jgi:hypothetical protein
MQPTPSLRASQPPLSARPRKHGGQIWRGNGPLEPTFKGWQPGPMNSLAQERLHCAESFRQKTNERLGFPLGFPSGEPLGFSFSAPFPLEVFSYLLEITRYVAFEHQ